MLIIKNGIEAALQGDLEAPSLPKNFWKGFDLASKSPQRTRIPYILQLYFEVFGGFMIDDTDRAQLATLAGAPVEAVTEALDLFDVFYPTGNGWRFSSKEIQMTKMIPGYLHGIGAFFRHDSRGLTKYSTVAPTMSWLVSKWHNATYALLEKELVVKDAAPEKKA